MLLKQKILEEEQEKERLLHEREAKAQRLRAE